MSSNQIIILCIMIGYLVLNVAIGMWMAKKQEAGSTMSKEKKYFIGSRGMNGLVLAMTTMATMLITFRKWTNAMRARM